MTRDEKHTEKPDRSAEPQSDREPADDESPETAEHPAPGIRHAREPSAENIMPVEGEPGTL